MEDAAAEPKLTLRVPGSKPRRSDDSKKMPPNVSITDSAAASSNGNGGTAKGAAQQGIMGQSGSGDGINGAGGSGSNSSCGLNSPKRNPKDNELILRMSPSPERFKRKRSNTFSESPRSGKGKFKSTMAALVMYASMEDNEVEAAKLLTSMGSAGKKAKLPDFLADKSPRREGKGIKKEEEEDGNKSVTMVGETPKNARNRGSSFDALTATAAAVMGEEDAAAVMLPLPPMPNKSPAGRPGGGDAKFPFPEGRSSSGAALGPGGAGIGAGAGTGTGIADRQRRTASGRTVVPDFANFATGGVVRNLPAAAPVIGGFKDLGGPAFDSLRKASRGSSLGSAGGMAGGNVRGRAETISDGPSHTVNRMDKIGIYGPEERKARITRFLEKRRNRVWAKKVKYDVRKNFADSRVRIKGRFVKKEDEAALNTMTTLPDGGPGPGPGGDAQGKARSGSSSSTGSRR